jgi:hypothetical protein
MHVKNKKAFYFKDSLYRFIEQVAGFAMELHPDSLTQIITAYAEGRLNFGDYDWDDRKKIDDKYLDSLFAKFKSNAAISKKSRRKRSITWQKRSLTAKRKMKTGWIHLWMPFFLDWPDKMIKRSLALNRPRTRSKHLVICRRASVSIRSPIC